MLYLVPTCHNPTGRVMSELRRRELLRIAASWRIPVIEDTVMAELLASPAPPDLAALEPQNVLSVGSLSKCFWGGLRVGWIRAPVETVLRLGRARAAMDLGSPGLSQALAARVLEDFELATRVPRERAAERLDVLLSELRAELPQWSFTAPSGGLSVWVQLPGAGAGEFAQLALRHGVAISAGTASGLDERFSAHVRLCAGPSPELIREGVRQLAVAWGEMSAGAPSRLSEPRVAV
jgi:DNA-binding transcriptional MocR family regulator